MLRVTLISAFAAVAYGALELTPDNFDKEVKETGKAAFIKFLAPW
jgi:protein disulfide-isomerase A6